MKINELLNERIKNNEKIFTKEEINFIKENDKIVNKIYIIGILDTYKSGQKSGQLDLRKNISLQRSNV